MEAIIFDKTIGRTLGRIENAEELQSYFKVHSMLGDDGGVEDTDSLQLKLISGLCQCLSLLDPSDKRLSELGKKYLPSQSGEYDKSYLDSIGKLSEELMRIVSLTTKVSALSIKFSE